ncbi:MAG: PIN domain-containing protein [Micrococcales bacterium]|nr:PIN domain-containing protein [Micrococcales bacterium]
MTPEGLVFVDTNILVCFRDNTDARKNAIATDWLRKLAQSRRGRISTQILAEFYAVATRGDELARETAAAQADVESFTTWDPVQPDIELFRRAWKVAERYSLSWWDSMVVAAALMAGCDTLLSEDLQHGLVVEQTLTIINPFIDQ